LFFIFNLHDFFYLPLGLLSHFWLLNFRLVDFFVEPVMFVLGLPCMFYLFSINNHLAVDHVLPFILFLFAPLTAYGLQVVPHPFTIHPSPQLSQTSRKTVINFQIGADGQCKKRLRSASKLIHLEQYDETKHENVGSEEEEACQQYQDRQISLRQKEGYSAYCKFAIRLSTAIQEQNNQHSIDRSSSKDLITLDKIQQYERVENNGDVHVHHESLFDNF